jgi:hypothetical protein
MKTEGTRRNGPGAVRVLAGIGMERGKEGTLL